MSSAVEELTEEFKLIGFSETRSKEITRNLKLSNSLKLFLNSVKLNEPNSIKSEKQSILILQINKDSIKLNLEDKLFLVKSVLDERLISSEQLSGLSSVLLKPHSNTWLIVCTTLSITAAIKYLTVKPSPVDDAEFDQTCGVGKFSFLFSYPLTHTDSSYSIDFRIHCNIRRNNISRIKILLN